MSLFYFYIVELPTEYWINNVGKNIRNATMKIIENSAHIVNEENPNELSKLLIEFWRN